MDSDKLWGLGYGLSPTSSGGWAMDSHRQAVGAGLWTLTDKLWGLGYGLSLTALGAGLWTLTNCGGWAMDSDKL